MRPSSIAWLLAGLALLCFAGVTLATVDRPQAINAPAVAGGLGGPFDLIDQDGRPVTEKSWPGKYLLFYFGFTHCPDVCPLGLSKIAEAYGRLPADDRAVLQPLFVTVDPARDTAAELKAYVALYGANLSGLTGSEAQIAHMKQIFKVYAQKQGDGPDYMVNHSSFTYLLDPQGSLVGLYGHETSVEEMTAQIAQAMRVKK